MTALLLLSLLGGGAEGVQKGGTLYIKSKDAILYQSSKPGSKRLGPLKVGDAVTWQGAADDNPSMQKVEIGKKHGFVATTDLTPFRPVDEYARPDGKPISVEAFKASGASCKDCGGMGAPPYDPTHENEAAKLMALEGSSEAAKENVAAHVKAAGLKEAK